MDGNPYQSPNASACTSVPQPTRRRRARIALIAQICWTGMFIVIGMSESYASLHWAQPLIPLVDWFLFPAAIAFPAAILILSRKEDMPPWQRVFGLLLSVVLSVVSFFAIIPLVS